MFSTVFFFYVVKTHHTLHFGKKIMTNSDYSQQPLLFFDPLLLNNSLRCHSKTSRSTRAPFQHVTHDTAFLRINAVNPWRHSLPTHRHSACSMHRPEILCLSIGRSIHIDFTLNPWCPSRSITPTFTPALKNREKKYY